MCVVTYFPSEKEMFLTSNRDEKNTRKTVHPKTYKHEGLDIIYPKDLEQGGSWLAINATEKRLACLLNAKGVQPNPKDKISRGTIPINFVLNEKSVLQKNMLKKVAPFTLICIDYVNRIFIEEFHWHGNNMSLKLIDEKKPQLWCSNTLYTAKEKNRFTTKFKGKKTDIKSLEDIVNFHKEIAQPLQNNVFIKKDKDIQTMSITGVQATAKSTFVSYSNLVEKSTRILTTAN